MNWIQNLETAELPENPKSFPVGLRRSFTSNTPSPFARAESHSMDAKNSQNPTQSNPIALNPT